MSASFGALTPAHLYGEDNQRGVLTERPQGLVPTRKLARWLMVNI